MSNNIPTFIQENISLKDKNWFKTGGPSRYFCQPTTAQEFQQAVSFAHAHNVETFLLGKGANILISDAGFDGLTIRPYLKNSSFIEVDNYVLLTAGAGVALDSLINYCLDNGIIGLEEFSGIPSTIGGAVYINLHYFEFLLEQFLFSARVIHAVTGELLVVDNAWFNFGYNSSRLHKHDYYLADATFKLKRATPTQAEYARGRSHEIIRHRSKRYPTKNTCGSFFRNFHADEVSFAINGAPILFVAYYLDKIGVKGTLSVGDAFVSAQHANMIVNKEAATTKDIIELARRMQMLVKDTFNILPQPECQLIGFKEYPLIP